MALKGQIVYKTVSRLHKSTTTKNSNSGFPGCQIDQLLEFLKPHNNKVHTCILKLTVSNINRQH